jgi:head-tail adaptor
MAVGKGPASRYNRRLRIEKEAPDDSFDSAGSDPWVPVAAAWASVQDVLPSRAESAGQGINITNRPARVRMRYRTDIDASMRFNLGREGKDEDGNPIWRSERIVQIISGPAEIGFREEVEFMVESYSASGNGA